MSGPTLTEFLRARLDDDEVAARAAREGSGRDWTVSGSVVFDDATNPIVEALPSDVYPPETLAHIARHDPARVLADVKAKRAIVEREHGLLRDLWRRRVDEHRLTFDAWLQEWPPATLRDLASVYADHPDYDATWAP